MSSFGETFWLYFSVYPDTISWTLLLFSALFLIIGIGNMRIIRRQKIIDMLHDNQKTESTSMIKDMLRSSLAVGCAITYTIFQRNIAESE